eukprot:gene18270-25707_t
MSLKLNRTTYYHHTLFISTDDCSYFWSLIKQLPPSFIQVFSFCQLNNVGNNGIRKDNDHLITIRLFTEIDILKRANQLFGTVESTLLRTITKEESKNIIRSHMFLKEKHHADDGSFDELKARFVAGGDMQDKALYEDISSSTASSQTVFITAGIAAYEGRVVKVGDVPGAYLNSPTGK